MNQHHRIIDMASRLFNQSGYKGTSLKKIADRVGIHQSTLFHYFKNKEEILLAVIDFTYRDLLTSIGRIIEDKELSPEEKLREAIKNHITLQAKHLGNVNVLNSEIHNLSPKNRKKFLEIRKGYTSSFERIVAEVKESGNGYFKGQDTKIVAFGILGMLIWEGRWYRKGRSFNPEQIADIFFQMLVQGKSS